MVVVVTIGDIDGSLDSDATIRGVALDLSGLGRTEVIREALYITRGWQPEGMPVHLVLVSGPLCWQVKARGGGATSAPTTTTSWGAVSTNDRLSVVNATPCSRATVASR